MFIEVDNNIIQFYGTKDIDIYSYYRLLQIREARCFIQIHVTRVQIAETGS